MYVGDRDTRDDVFCQDCGNIADRETLDRDGVCDNCRPREMTDARIAEIVSVVQNLYVILTSKDGTIELCNERNLSLPVHTFKDWESLETWAIEMEWEPEIDEGIGYP